MKKILVLLLAAALAMNLSGCFLAFMGDDDDSSQTITDNSVAPKDNESKGGEEENTAAKVGQTVTGEKWAISLLSAKTYTEIVDEYYTEKPDEGKIFLVLFFEVENVSAEDDYFNRLNFESYVDGYSQSHDVLMNSPDGYRTLTGDIAAGKKLKGCLTWEVSPDWSELEVSYKSSVWGSGKTATFVVKPEDITA